LIEKTEKRILNKKSLCAENAEANSERNLYNPPSGLVLSFSHPVKASFLIRQLLPSCYI
jgi:hypothetical protein